MDTRSDTSRRIVQDEEALRRRLAELAARHSQAALARAAGISSNRIHYYLNGSNMPASVCTALVRELGVNPAWLISGEGSPYLSDVAHDEAVTVTGVLDLVERLNGFSRMRLGALSANNNTKVYQELNRSLTTYHETKEKLNDRARPVFRRLLDEFSSHIQNDRHGAAQGLRLSIEQVAKLCDDESLLLEYDQHVARLDHQLGRFEQAIARYRRIFVRSFVHADALSEEALELLWQYISLLAGMRHKDAYRVAKTILAFHSDSDERQPLKRILFIKAFLDLDYGRIRRADRDMRAAYSFFGEDGQKIAQPALLLVEVVMGTLALSKAVNTLRGCIDQMSERRRVISVSPLLMAATAFEDEQSIQPLLALMRTNVTIEDTPGTVLLLHHQAEALLAIKKDKASVNHFLQHKDVATAMKSGDAGAIFCYHVFCCQLWRKTNHHAKAMEHFVKADKALRETRKDYLHRITVRMLHERNALLLFQRNKKAEESVDRGSQARAHLERLRRKGFACVRPWLVEIAEKD